MSSDIKDSAICPECGSPLPPDTGACPGCGADAQEKWEKERNRLKTLWVIVTVFFWFSLCFQGALFILDGTLNLILLSVIGGLMVIGVVLKYKYQRHERGQPPG